MNVLSNIHKLQIISFIAHLHFFGAVLVPFFLEWGGISFFVMMLLQAWYTVANTLLEVPTGAFADRFGHKNSIVLGIAVQGLGFLVYVIEPSVWFFVLGELLLALGFSLLSGADSALMYDSLKDIGKEKQVDRYFGRYQSLSIAGLLVAAPIGSMIAGRFGLAAPMFAMLAPMFLCFIVALTLREPHASYHERTLEEGHIAGLLSGWRQIRENKIIWSLALDLAVVATISRLMIWLYQPLLQSVGIAISTFGWISAAALLVEVLLMADVERMDRFLKGRVRVLRITQALTVVGLILAVVALVIPQKSVAVVFAVMSSVFVIGFGLCRRPYVEGPINQMLPSQNRATTNSTIRMMYIMAGAVLDPIVGLLAGVHLIIPFAMMAAGLMIWIIVTPVRHLGTLVLSPKSTA